MVDEFCSPPEADPKRSAGRPVTFNDNMILKMEMLGRLSRIKGETRVVKAFGTALQRPVSPFAEPIVVMATPANVDASGRSLSALSEVQARGFDLEDIRLIDTLPMPVFNTAGPGRATTLI